MISKATSLINEAGTDLGPIERTSRNMAIQVTGEAGTITGSTSIDGVNFSDIDTYDFTGPTEVIAVTVPCTIVKFTTTGTFTEAWVVTED